MQTIPITGNEMLAKMAAQAPVALTQGEKEVAVVLSKADYDRIMRRNAESFQRFCDEVGQRAESRGMTETVLNQLLSDES
jgi:PHD/YefM family antitoxin component YafN of YafNO toxin-antitoxin module